MKYILIAVISAAAALFGYYFFSPGKALDPADRPGSLQYEKKMEELRRKSTMRDPSLILQRPPQEPEKNSKTR